MRCREPLSTSDDGAQVFTWRVWPDSTVQAVEDGDPHAWMSDDYMLIDAADEEDALARFDAIESKAWGTSTSSAECQAFGLRHVDEGVWLTTVTSAGKITS